MFLSFDKFVVSDPQLKPHLRVELDFVGYFNNWTTTSVTDCQTSSRWSECTVNAYHLCGQANAAAAGGGGFDGWWAYSKCLYQQQYPLEECAGLNPLDANHTCSRELFPAIMRSVSDGCAGTAKLDAAAIGTCVRDGKGLQLLKQSFNKTLTFPRNPHGYTEPQWIEVDGPQDCSNFTVCKPAFDKTACEDWDSCDSDAWAQHLASDARMRLGL